MHSRAWHPFCQEVRTRHWPVDCFQGVDQCATLEIFWNIFVHKRGKENHEKRIPFVACVMQCAFRCAVGTGAVEFADFDAVFSRPDCAVAVAFYAVHECTTSVVCKNLGAAGTGVERVMPRIPGLVGVFRVCLLEDPVPLGRRLFVRTVEIALFPTLDVNALSQRSEEYGWSLGDLAAGFGAFDEFEAG